MKKILLPLLMLLPVFALAGPKEEALLNKLPETLNGFAGRHIESFPDVRLGSAAGYYVADGDSKTILTVIVFDAGLGPIADGVDSDVTGKAFRGALADVHTMEKMGKYKDVNELSKGLVDLADRKAYLAQLSYQLVQDNGSSQPLRSYLVMTGLQGYMLKVRVTSNAAPLNEADLAKLANAVVKALNG